MHGQAIEVGRRDVLGASVLRPYGVLDAGSYLALRNVLVKAAIDEPRAVIVDLADLQVPEHSAYALFASVCDQLAQWPGVPLLLAAETDQRRRQLDEYRLGRYVPVFPSVADAAAAIGAPPPRRIARRTLPNGLRAAALARAFVCEHCADWSVGQHADDAVTIVNELVENTLLHTYSAPSLRLELRRGLLTVGVYDDDPRRAQLREPAPGERHHGLALVASLARAWGCAPTPAGGKVVWATLRTGQGVACPGEHRSRPER